MEGDASVRGAIQRGGARGEEEVLLRNQLLGPHCGRSEFAVSDWG
jgi:hypothetical protein